MPSRATSTLPSAQPLAWKPSAALPWNSRQPHGLQGWSLTFPQPNSNPACTLAWFHNHLIDFYEAVEQTKRCPNREADRPAAPGTSFCWKGESLSASHWKLRWQRTASCPMITHYSWKEVFLDACERQGYIKAGMIYFHSTGNFTSGSLQTLHQAETEAVPSRMFIPYQRHFCPYDTTKN